MVDPLSLGAITTAVTAAAGSVGTEAGRQAWGSLVDLARRTFGRGRDDDSATALLPLDPADDEQVQSLSALLFAQALQNPGFAAEFRAWAESARPHLSVDNSQVHNTVSGNAQVGHLVQGKDITWTSN
ncbi:hypothetical protein ACQEVX_31390 [Streptomyces syringium]|uniref:Uncharacterized protein n=1 Tax=Streptomyces syringium TaxID=76729 RepID=A0ABS4YBX8_9ACTN|nr:hypothetical protein [Streptomyces syringium]MBP2406301.1 hypothetical protein [Streptomyces syringium]SPE63803.1 hypothetical protein SNS2_5127 [Streptomyces netropsis]